MSTKRLVPSQFTYLLCAIAALFTSPCAMIHRYVLGFLLKKSLTCNDLKTGRSSLFEGRSFYVVYSMLIFGVGLEVNYTG